MKILIIGLGSIAQKHIQAIRQIETNVEIFALRSSIEALTINGVKNIYNWSKIPFDIDFIIISNPTSEHKKTILKSLELNKPLFIEKPPLMCLEDAGQIINKVLEKNVVTYTAFNFRFHPLILWAKENIKIEEIREVNAYCGSYLPDWRPNCDYRSIYSANANMGGGVHLDLIHEIDYIIYLFGQPLNSRHQFRKVSDLEINSIDSAHYWLNYPKFTASIILNYFRKTSKRHFEIITINDVYSLDLINMTICDSKGSIIFHSNESILDTYYKQLNYFVDLLKYKKSPMNSIKESVATLKVCLGYEK